MWVLIVWDGFFMAGGENLGTVNHIFLLFFSVATSPSQPKDIKRTKTPTLARNPTPPTPHPLPPTLNAQPATPYSPFPTPTY